MLVAGAFAMLTWAFVVQDFSVEYVARNSNSQLPMEYRFSAVWGSHEGSLLLWELILCLWTFAVALFSARLPEDFRARVLAVLGWVSCGFLLFVIFTSNPFGRLLPAAVDGMDLNPLLQDPGLIIHPPMLYMGYVGFAVSFAFAVAALLGQQVDRDWVRWSRPWTHVAWAFLTLGIALGSWWAYYELGWGGWWFWDPVENASFMPWLVGTALIHSQAVTEKRGAFRNWTLILAITAFSLCLLGTFLVRSGVLTSVHAFASDPTRGVFILTYLFVVVGGSLLLFALRAPAMVQGGTFSGVSRETLLLINNLLLTVMAAMVLTGTLYPLLLDALDAGKISVGPPYFGTLFATVADTHRRLAAAGLPCPLAAGRPAADAARAVAAGAVRAGGGDRHGRLAAHRGRLGHRRRRRRAVDHRRQPASLREPHAQHAGAPAFAQRNRHDAGASRCRPVPGRRLADQRGQLRKTPAHGARRFLRPGRLHLPVRRHARTCGAPISWPTRAPSSSTRDGERVTTLHPQKRRYSKQPGHDRGRAGPRPDPRPVRFAGRTAGQPGQGLGHPHLSQAVHPLHLARRADDDGRRLPGRQRPALPRARSTARRSTPKPRVTERLAETPA